MWFIAKMENMATTFLPSQCQTGVPLVYQLLLQKGNVETFQLDIERCSFWRVR